MRSPRAGQGLRPDGSVNTLMPGPFPTDISKAWALEDNGGGDVNLFAGYALQRGEPEIVGAALLCVRRVELHHRIDPARRRWLSVTLPLSADYTPRAACRG